MQVIKRDGEIAESNPDKFTAYLKAAQTGSMYWQIGVKTLHVTKKGFDGRNTKQHQHDSAFAGTSFHVYTLSQNTIFPIVYNDSERSTDRIAVHLHFLFKKKRRDEATTSHFLKSFFGLFDSWRTNCIWISLMRIIRVTFWWNLSR